MEQLEKRLSILAWSGVLGYLVLYVYGLVMGVFSPAELIGFTLVAIGAATAFLVHAIRIRHAILFSDDPAHDHLMRGLHRQREKRGF